jgi:hypothetical protein
MRKFGLEEEIRITETFTDYIQKISENDRELEGEVIESKPVIRSSLMTTSKYMQKIDTFLGGANNVGIMPPNCRYMETIQDHKMIVIEEPPAYRTIKVDALFEDDVHSLGSEKLAKYNIDASKYITGEGRPYSFTLALPYVIFIMLLNPKNDLLGAQMYLRTSRLLGLADYLYTIPFMNISHSQYICFGHNTPVGFSVNSTVETILDKFWSSTFNTDYTCNYNAYKGIPYVSTYIEWQAMTKINPLFIYQVEWVNSKNTLFDVMKVMKSNYNITPKRNIKYQMLRDIFDKPTKMGDGTEDGDIFYDVAQGKMMGKDDNVISVNVGDSFMWGSDLVYVESFIGYPSRITKVRLKFEKRDSIDVKLTNRIENYIASAVKKVRYESRGTMRNGTVIKEGDIVVIELHGQKLYKKVGLIRRNFDGLIEAKLGRDFYVLENVDGVVFDIEKDIKYNNIPLVVGKDYIISEIEKIPIDLTAQYAKFNGFGVDDRHNTITLAFHSNHGDDYNISMNMETLQPRISKTKVYDPLNCTPLPSVFRFGRELVVLKRRDDDRESFFLKTKDAILSDYCINSYVDDSETPFKTVIDNVLINDKTTFRVESYDLDIEFSIGDKIVVSNWDSPENMLIPKIILGFKVDEDRRTIEFIVQTNDGKTMAIPYVEYHTTSKRKVPVIYVGRIRKIVNKYGSLSAGTKIKAKVAQIPYFPKKDTNIIIGFLTDTGVDEPLVLCSNCCTLWYNDVLTKFDLISMKSKKWKKLDHVGINISSIKMQPGDIVTSTDYHSERSYLITKRNMSSGLTYMYLNEYTRRPYLNTFDNYIQRRSKFDCILSPRMSLTEVNTSNRFKGLYNLHGAYRVSSESYLTFVDNERIRLNV